MSHIFREVLSIDLPRPFPRLTHAESIARYGTDKPDTRLGMEIHGISDLVAGCEFRVFSEAVSSGGKVAGILARGCASYSRSALDRLQEIAIAAGAKGLAWLKITETIDSPIAKFLSNDRLATIAAAFSAKPGDLVLLLAGHGVERPLGELRLTVARQQEQVQRDWQVLWITDFPLFELNDEGVLTSAHHPFTAPRAEDIDRLESEPLSVLSNAYDLVLNGTELGSGSIRIHRRELQERVFRMLRVPAEDADLRFGFFLRALDFGAPPHGGFALGMDRLVMMMAGETSLRDVIAFPKTSTGACPLTEAPMPVPNEQLRDLGISAEDG